MQTREIPEKALPHKHFGYWINRESGRARCYDCGYQFTATDSSEAEDWTE